MTRSGEEASAKGGRLASAMEVAPRGTLFVTGMQRSGTTLVDKLLTSHSDVSVLSQPFPFLLFEAMRRFLRQLGEEETPLPLGPLFHEERYRPEDLAGFLRQEAIDGATVRRLVDAMASYSGQYTRVYPERLDAVLATL